MEFPEQHEENKLWVSRVTGFVKNNSNPQDPEPIAPGEPILVFTGGSTVAGDDIAHNEETIPSRLEAWLRDRCRAEGGTGKGIRVINAGVSGYNVTQEISYFLYDLSFYHPLAWVELTGINEAWHLGMTSGSTELHHNKVTRGYPLPDPPAASNWFPATQKLVMHWIPLLFRKRGLASDPWMVERREQAGTTAKRFVSTLAEASGASAAVDVPHYVFLQPTLAAEYSQENWRKKFPGIGDLETYWTLAHDFYKETRVLLQERQKRFPRWFDFTGIFAGRENVDGLYYGNRHYSEAGAKVLAEEIGKRIWPELSKRICVKEPRPR